MTKILVNEEITKVKERINEMTKMLIKKEIKKLKERIKEKTEQENMDMQTIGSLLNENRKQAKRIKELEAKLKKYGDHKDNCDYLRGKSIEDCDCGFVQALKGK